MAKSETSCHYPSPPPKPSDYNTQGLGTKARPTLTRDRGKVIEERWIENGLERSAMFIFDERGRKIGTV